MEKKIGKQIAGTGLPRIGSVRFEPAFEINMKGTPIIKKGIVLHGPKAGKRGYVDSNRRIWIKDRAHAGDPDH